MKNLVQIRNLHKRYGSRVLFEGAGVAFQEKQKIGVMGRNGAGKSTLARILTGAEEADQGEIVTSQDLKVGYLEQKEPWQEDETVLGFLMRYSGLPDWQCGKMAGRFRLKNELLETRIRSLPGGYQMRVKLTAMLLPEPNFLILDEPTNYLDLQTLLLLESFLRNYNGGFLLISHDREFLKRTCEHTLDVERGNLFLYPGGVEEYLDFKEEQKEQILRYNKNVEARQKEMQSFIERFRAKTSKASLVQSRVKMLEKMKTIEIGHKTASVSIRIPRMPVKPGTALKLQGVTVGYPGKRVAGPVNVTVERGERLAVLGENGQGKTTFLRTVAEELPPLEGEIRLGRDVVVGHFAQHVYASMEESDDVLDYLEAKAAPGVTRQEILDMAGSFLFRGDDVKKPVSVLSGGERARLCLAGLLLGKSDLLLLDEPTNHLDFETVEALGDALRRFPGTILVVSHDRTFVNLVATGILEVAGGNVSLFPGNYEEYVFRLQIQLEEEEASPAQSPLPVTGGGEKKSRNQLRKESRSRLKQLENSLLSLEKEMASLEGEKEEILKFYTENPGLYDPEKNERMESITNRIQTLEEEWLEAQQEQELEKARLEELA